VCPVAIGHAIDRSMASRPSRLNRRCSAAAHSPHTPPSHPSHHTTRRDSCLSCLYWRNATPSPRTFHSPQPRTPHRYTQHNTTRGSFTLAHTATIESERSECGVTVSSSPPSLLLRTHGTQHITQWDIVQSDHTRAPYTVICCASTHALMRSSYGTV
jgi:hypothetical protein